MKKPVREIDNNKILTSHQRDFIRRFAASDLKDAFRLTGGTALSAFYLEHRLSEDLDFFSTEKVPLYSIEGFLKTLPGVSEISQNRLFDRQIFSLKLKENTILKVEFTFYPLKNLEETVRIDTLQVDGFLDIVVNKLCAVADRFDAKDYVDVYCAVKSQDLSLADLFGLAEKKCEVKGIRSVLKNRLLQIPDGVSSLPLKVDIKKENMERFFQKQIREIVKKEL